MQQISPPKRGGDAGAKPPKYAPGYEGDLSIFLLKIVHIISDVTSINVKIGIKVTFHKQTTSVFSNVFSVLSTAYRAPLLQGVSAITNDHAPPIVYFPSALPFQSVLNPICGVWNASV